LKAHASYRRRNLNTNSDIKQLEEGLKQNRLREKVQDEELMLEPREI